MAALFALALKDLRLLVRDRAAVFLTFAWPLALGRQDVAVRAAIGR